MARYRLRVNGREHEVQGEPRESLLSVLRHELQLTGSKYGCGEGQCGACTVLLGDEAVRSCVTRIDAVGARAVTTIEGLASGDRLHPVQEAFLETEAFQCGYCTPGMIMAAVGLLRSNAQPGPGDIASAMNHSVCRCGTYSRIVRAVQLAASRVAPHDDEGGRS